MKRGIFAAITAVVAALIVPVPAASAAVSYTWIAGWLPNGQTVAAGIDHTAWDDARNWSPQGVPGPSDTVRVTNAPSSSGPQSVTELAIPARGVTVARITIEQPLGGAVRVRGGGLLTVTGSFTWTGGEIYAPVRIAGSATGQISSGPDKELYDRLTVDGKLQINNIGTSDDRLLRIKPKTGRDNDGILVTKSGTLTLSGANTIAGTICCTDPAQIVNKGTVTVTSGMTTFSALEFDQLGTVTVAKKARLVNTVGAARLGAGAKYGGGGTLEFTATANISAHPDKDVAPGGILMQGKGTLAGGTRLLFGAGAKLTGVGSFTGKGAIDLVAKKNTGEQYPTVYGSLKTGPKVTVTVDGPHSPLLGVYSPTIKGYHGVLTIGGKATIGKGKTLIAASGTKTTVAKGGTLVLKPGSTFGAGGCCTDMATLTIAKGGVLAIPKAGQAKATVLRATLAVKGAKKPAGGNLLVTR